MQLQDEVNQGVMPELLPPAFIAKAIAVSDDAPETVVAHAWAFSHAFHQHRNDDAARMLEVCLRYSSCVPPPNA